jgi:lipid A 3-O-deacylase
MRFLLLIFVILMTHAISFNKVAASDLSQTSSQQYQFLYLTTGQIGIEDNIAQPNLYGIEFHAKPFELFSYPIRPAFGYAASDGGTQYLNVNFRYDYWLNDNWVMTPLWGFGYFKDSDEIKLGHELEFVSGLEIAYQLRDRYRIGLMITHLSNGSISNENPGTETAVLSLTIPLDSD